MLLLGTRARLLDCMKSRFDFGGQRLTASGVEEAVQSLLFAVKIVFFAFIDPALIVLT